MRNGGWGAAGIKEGVGVGEEVGRERCCIGVKAREEEGGERGKEFADIWDGVELAGYGKHGRWNNKLEV